MFGMCRETKGEYARQAELLYGKRFQAFTKWKTTDSDDVSVRYHFYRFVAREIKILDENEFGGGVFVSAALRFHTRDRGKTERRHKGA
jgi:hypothetical protein